MPTFYVNPRNAQKRKRKKKKSGPLRIGLSHFLRKPIHPLVLLGSIILAGVMVFAVVMWRLAEHEYNVIIYGHNTSATVIDCEMVSGLGRTSLYVTYQYTVKGETYSTTWQPQANYSDCASIPNPWTIDILYLDNDPAHSLVGNKAQHSGSGVLLPIVLAISAGANSSLLIIRNLSGYAPALRRWWNQGAYVVALRGEIVAVMEKGRHQIEIVYYYQAPEGRSRLGKAILSRRRRHLPQIGMDVVVLYYNRDIVSVA